MATYATLHLIALIGMVGWALVIWLIIKLGVGK